MFFYVVQKIFVFIFYFRKIFVTVIYVFITIKKEMKAVFNMFAFAKNYIYLVNCEMRMCRRSMEIYSIAFVSQSK